MKPNYVLICACMLLACEVLAGTPAPADVDKIFSDYDNTRSAGCSMAVYRDGQIAYARGYGMANLEYGIANAPDTVFRIGSTAKQFTAMAIAILAERGKLSLDDDIHKFFPALPDYGEPVSVRQLIHHTSGLRDYLELAWLADWGDGYTVDEALQMILRQPDLNFAPGSDNLYSNTGYFLLSQIVQTVTGQSLRDWTQQNMFTPLEMTHTHFHDDHTHIVPRRADGYEPDGQDGFRISMTTLDMVGDGGVYTTVEDLLKWDRNFYANTLGGGAELIDLVQTPGRLSNGDKLDYAFGLSIGEHQGHREISHGGAFVGYRAGLNRYPEQRLSVAVLCNHAGTDPTSMARRVADLYLHDFELEKDVTAGPGTPVGEPREVIDVAPADLERFAGDYWNADQLMVRSVVLQDGLLFYDRGGDNRSRLDPVGDDQFSMAGVPVQVSVIFEPAGKTPAAMRVEVRGREPIRLERFERATPGSAVLETFAGAYHSNELGHTQVLVVEEGVLTAVRRRSREALQPLKPDWFFSPEGVVLQFERAADGTVNGFRLQAGRVRNIGYMRR